MTHSIDEGSPLFLTQAFHDSVQSLVQSRGIRFTAEQLKMIGVSFEAAYELIFNRTPREWSILEQLKLRIKADKEAEARDDAAYADINRPGYNLERAREKLSAQYPKE